MTRLLELRCTSCDHSWDVTDPAEGRTTDARELGDGTICLMCPDCRCDIAVVAAPSEHTNKGTRP